MTESQKRLFKTLNNFKPSPDYEVIGVSINDHEDTVSLYLEWIHDSNWFIEMIFDDNFYSNGSFLYISDKLEDAAEEDYIESQGYRLYSPNMQRFELYISKEHYVKLGFILHSELL